MKKILFFETKEFTGATRVSHTLAKAANTMYKVAFAQVGDNINADIESAIEAEEPDILFSSFIRINSDVIEIGKKHGLYVIIRNDYNLGDINEETCVRALHAYPMADEIIAQTKEMRDDLVSVLDIEPYKVRVIDNPLDEEDILEKAKESNPFHDNGFFHFLWVGRKDPIKDLATLQKAFEIVHHSYPDADLTLISEDPNPYRWMQNADCLVISSKSEASPNVLREALFLRIPVVSTDCSPTVRKLLNDNSIAQVGNPNDLANKMIAVIKMSELLLVLLVLL